MVLDKTSHCVIPVELSHLTTSERRAAAEWAIEKYGQDNVDVMRPLLQRIEEGPALCKEIVMVPCFWFATQKQANWFLLRWSR